MLELFQNLSDDQTALLGCVAAIGGATLMLMLSFHANPNNRQRSIIDGDQSTNQFKSESLNPQTEDEKEQRHAA